MKHKCRTALFLPALLIGAAALAGCSGYWEYRQAMQQMEKLAADQAQAYIQETYGLPGELGEIYPAAGIPLCCVSAETGAGMEALRQLLSGKLSAFTGNSGVGKSSILNRLDPRFALSTGAISEKLRRGRHTTRHVELFTLGSGAEVVDTPGFSSFEEGELNLQLKEALPETFREFVPYLGRCRFAGCSHTREKGCAVIAAVRSGDIPHSRHESYCRLRQELKDLREWNQRGL